MADDLELRHLRYFVAVAEELHFGRAAARLHMAQPPLSQQIQRLERIVGAQLLERNSRRVALTPAGHALLRSAKATLGQAEAAADEANRVGRGEQGRLRVGYVSSAVLLGVPARIRSFRSKYPLVHVGLVEDFTSAVIGGVLEGSLDVGIARDPAPNPELVAATLASEGFVAVLPSNHRLAGATTVNALDLATDPFVLYPRTAGELAFQRNLQPLIDAGTPPLVVQEASHWMTITHLVASGLGVTIAPESALAGAPTTGIQILPLEDFPARSEVQLVYRRDNTSPLLINFLATQVPEAEVPEAEARG